MRGGLNGYKSNLKEIYDFLESNNQINIRFLNPKDQLDEIHRKQPKKGIYLAYRHNDLHCENCLVSETNFKVIDIFDSLESLCCSDLVRLEFSVLSSLITILNLSNDDVKNIYVTVNGGISDDQSYYIQTIPKILIRIRNCFYSQFSIKPTDFDIAFAYYLELCKQISYSLASPKKIPSQMIHVIRYWNEKLISQT